MTGVSVTGHAGYGAYGQDIVCASVTSALQLAVNGITEVLGIPAKVETEENLVALALEDNLAEEQRLQAGWFLQALLLHLELLEEDYRKNIKVTVLEV